MFLANDELLDRLVAVKVARPDRFTDDDSREAFIREAKTVAQLRHPAIVTIHDVGMDASGRCFAVLEYVPGKTLRQFAREAKPSCAEIARLLARVCDGLTIAHAKGFVHRDLKPSNIMIDEAGEPRILDFGLAHHESQRWARRGEISGSPLYMAPEQISGEIQFSDGRADLWAIGVILYELLTGQLPFNGPTAEAVADEILHRDPRPPRQLDARIPRPLETICLRCLEKRPADRFLTAADLASALLSAASPDPIAQAALADKDSAPAKRVLFSLSGTLGGIGCGATITCSLLLVAGLTMTLMYTSPSQTQIARTAPPPQPTSVPVSRDLDIAADRRPNFAEKPPAPAPTEPPRVRSPISDQLRITVSAPHRSGGFEEITLPSERVRLLKSGLKGRVFAEGRDVRAAVRSLLLMGDGTFETKILVPRSESPDSGNNLSFETSFEIRSKPSVLILLSSPDSDQITNPPIDFKSFAERWRTSVGSKTETDIGIWTYKNRELENVFPGPESGETPRGDRATEPSGATTPELTRRFVELVDGLSVHFEVTAAVLLSPFEVPDPPPFAEPMDHPAPPP